MLQAPSSSPLLTITSISIEPNTEKACPILSRTQSSRLRLRASNKEAHSEHGEIVRDAILDFADGLAVPLAFTQGLSSCARLLYLYPPSHPSVLLAYCQHCNYSLGSSKFVIVGGLAELFSGSISMGLGAYLAAVTDRDHYFSEEKRERAEVCEKPEAEQEECRETLETY